MLSSITPLGLRGRGNSWLRTVVGFWIGAIAAAVVVFSLMGVIGDIVGLDAANPWLGLIVIVTALFLDLGGVKPPGPHRQVDEDWLGRYRDWVVGLGYGTQLGLGFMTIVPTFGYWALLLVAASAGMPVAVYLGVAFGMGRSLLLVSTRKVKSPSALSETMRRFAGGETTARWLGFAGYGLVVIVVGLNAF